MTPRQARALLVIALLYVVLFVGPYLALVMTGHPHEAHGISEADVVIAMLGYFLFLARRP